MEYSGTGPRDLVILVKERDPGTGPVQVLQCYCLSRFTVTGPGSSGRSSGDLVVQVKGM
ncbi:hypothetical protein DPMN_181585 [Dreissena polymorpha]|uniref:Uncharacterized protein n=1 Tax=Dreissena polymorpha TaxID=45954 RepID=A0A9D4DD61_DREPO|nr:hypothetical protein DPMN_181585 [Dreissena polymorpha]